MNSAHPERKPHDTLTSVGFLLTLGCLIFPALALPAFVIGAVVTARGRTGWGVAIMVGSVVIALLVVQSRLA